MKMLGAALAAAVLAFAGSASAATVLMNFEVREGERPAIDFVDHKTPIWLDTSAYAARVFDAAGTAITPLIVGTGGQSHLVVPAGGRVEVFAAHSDASWYLAVTHFTASITEDVAFETNGQSFVLSPHATQTWTDFSLPAVDKTLRPSGFTLFAGSSDVLIDKFLISSVPEPATWAMMIVGFGLTGTFIRSGRAGARRTHPALTS